MIDITNGLLTINSELMFYPGYKFDDFKKTKYYKGQNDVRGIYLKDMQDIDGKHYLVNFFFINRRIYVVSLINCDYEISEEYEYKRKTIHDNILAKDKIRSAHQYEWGKVDSEYDARSNISSINIYYN